MDADGPAVPSWALLELLPRNLHTSVRSDIFHASRHGLYNHHGGDHENVIDLNGEPDARCQSRNRESEAKCKILPKCLVFRIFSKIREFPSILGGNMRFSQCSCGFSACRKHQMQRRITDIM